MTLKRWVMVAAGVVLVAIFAVMGWFIYSLYNKGERAEHLLAECQTAKQDTVIKYVDRVIVVHDTIRPKPVRTWIRTTDTVWRDVPHNLYSDTYNGEGGIRIKWRALTHGTLDELSFPGIFIPEKIVTITQKIPVHDTLRLQVERSHLGVYAKLFVNNFKSFPPVEAGLIYTYKGRGGLMAGAMFDPVSGKPYFTAGGVLYLK